MRSQVRILPPPLYPYGCWRRDEANHPKVFNELATLSGVPESLDGSHERQGRFTRGANFVSAQKATFEIKMAKDQASTVVPFDLLKKFGHHMIQPHCDGLA